MADKVLFVVVGAGASAAASTQFPRSPDWRPPLVGELFEPRFDEILADYPMAQNAAPDIRDALAAGREGTAKAVSLEDHLRTEYRDSDDPLNRRRFLSITLYLQHVLWSVSSREPAHFDNYDRLINRLVAAFDHVCFITLNYDLLLDRSLYAFAPLDLLASFIGDERWSLIKLHGSVTWSREIREPDAPRDLSNPPPDLEDRLGDKIFHHWSMNLKRLRQASRSNRVFPAFPALSVPVGSEDELVCPAEHLEFLKERLGRAPLDLLVIGYSAYDQAVIELLRDADQEISSLHVVNTSRADAVEVAKRMANGLGRELDDLNVSVALSNGFGKWCREELPGFVERHPALQRS